MIAKPLIPFSAMIGEEGARKSLFQPVSDSSARNLMSAPMQRRLSFDKPRLLSGKRSKRRQRHVSFTSQIDQVYEAPESHCDASVTDLWFTPFDFQRFLKTAQQEAKTIRIGDDEEYLIGVDQTHSIALRLSESVNLNLKDETLLNRIFKRLDMKNTGMAKWCLETPHRGLERIASKQLRHSKQFIRKAVKAIILPKDDDTISSGRSSSSRAKSPEELANAVQLQTKESRLFARMVGLADELAAQQAYKDEESY
jgi:hypothetical protein